MICRPPQYSLVIIQFDICVLCFDIPYFIMLMQVQAVRGVGS